MSLLMDALKRAETAKQEAARAQFGIAPPPPVEQTFGLEPINGEATGSKANPLPDLATHIEAVDVDLASIPLPQTSTAPPQPHAQTPSAPPPAEQTHRESVRNAFAAKQPAVPAQISRKPLWLAIGTLGIAAIGIGGYVWYQLNAMNRGTLAASNTPFVPPPPAPQPVPPVAPAPAQPPVANLPNPGEAVLFSPRREAPGLMPVSASW